MGNAYPNAKWCPERSIVELLGSTPSAGLQQILMREDLKEKCFDVNVGSDSQSNAWKEHHKVAFDVQKPEDYYLIVLFPCHPNPRKRTLYTYNYGNVTKLNREINARLRNSLQVGFDYDTVRMVIICGSVIYKLTNLIGTAYIVWASYVNTTNQNHIPNQIEQQIPLFVHMDGYNQFQSVLRILPEIRTGATVEPLNVANTIFFIPFKVFLWTDEADPRDQYQKPKKLSVATYEQVVDHCSDDDDAQFNEGTNALGALRHEPMPFSASEAESSNAGTPRQIDFTDLSSDDEVEALQVLGGDGTVRISSGTPRIEDELPGFVGLTGRVASENPDEKI